MSEINVILNGKPVTGKKGETILEMARRHGVVIPTLCHDDRLEPYSSCFVCVVELKGMRGLHPACSTKITEGMDIQTDNEKVRKSRKSSLDLMLSNHYADCMGPCKQKCPAGVDVQGYISLIEKGMYSEAVAVIKETNPFPAVCGRVCVRPCEVACRRNLLDEGTAVGIDYMKRFAADQDLDSKNKFKPTIKAETGKKVAVIGAGPGGLSAAFFLRKEGHTVDVFEASPAAGGWLRYGIPEYRLPNNLLQREVDNIAEMGVNINYNKRLGDNISFAELKQKYDAYVLGIGCQKGTGIGCEGDDAGNIFSGIDFLKQNEVNEERFNFKGKTVAVIGGGNTAMDCCRSSMRCGAEKVIVIYRRTEKEMPANPIEIHESKLEGIEYMFLTAPVKVNKDKNGNIETLTCIKMGLGEPDASGRRRPVPIEGSEVDVKLDIVLAAIGQKTEINFLDDINKVLGGELKPNKWGDLEADKNTLQTGIKNVFACGDGVTGAATLIEAVGQARIASLSCHQYLMGQPIVPLKKEFISRRESFKEQIAEDYSGKYNKQLREEMPTLNPKDRHNFNEVELGYENENVAVKEAHRCLECGCVEYFTCDLKKLSDEYSVEQQRFSGDFKEYRVDFRHPFIEIDNNKCILCSRCVRICNELNGANALGLVNRGFDTYVAPSMGQALFETDCETCGLCVSTCPTAAISENVSFKPGPVKMQTLDVICNYCSVGCAMSLHHKNGFVMKVTGRKGIANPDGSICRKGRFGYLYLNDKKRITQPMLKTNGKHEVISFEKAAEIIAGKIKSVKPDENAFFAGARMTNEEMYLVQKLARAAVKTNNVGSFHYAGKKDLYKNCNTYGNMPLDQLEGVKKIWLIGSEINSQNAVIGFMMNKLRFRNKATLELITTNPQNRMQKKVDSVMMIKSYYHFVKSVNHYLLSNKMENAMFIKDQCENFEEYSKKLLAEKFDDLVKASGCTVDQIKKFASEYNNEMNALIVFSEAEVSANAAIALYNLAMITGKLGKTSTGIMGLKEKNNSQGLFDMGITPDTGIGYQDMSDASFLSQLEGTWKTTGVPQNATSDLLVLLETGSVKNLFVFGEDPVGCATDQNLIKSKIGKSAFVVVQDYFMTDTALMADLILPASLPFEIGGHFTNTVGVIQKTNAVLHSLPAWNSCMQLTEVMKVLGVNSTSDPDELILEIASLLGKFNPDESDEKYRFIPLDGDNFISLFNFGCDSLGKRFAEEFIGKMKTAKETLALEVQA